jgi:predicted nucleic acid-binding protein
LAGVIVLDARVLIAVLIPQDVHHRAAASVVALAANSARNLL